MQFLIKKYRMNFGTQAANAEAYSPFFKHIDDIQNKRSRLFPDRRRIPGRKTKYLLAIGLTIQTFCYVRLFQHKAIAKKKAEQQVALQRKVAPLFQAVIDIQYTILKHRWDLLAKEVLGEQFVRKSNFHNPEITWMAMNRDIYGWARGGLDRYYGSPLQYHNNRYFSGYEIQNI